MHEIRYLNYNTTSNTTDIERNLNDLAYRNGGHGLVRPIRWIDKVFEDYDQAKAYIESIDRDYYDQIAVKYRHYSTPVEKELTKYQDIKSKASQASLAHVTLLQENHFTNVKAAFIGCATCGSKMNREHYLKNCGKTIKVNYCPICGNTLLKKTALDKIEAAKAKANKLKLQAQTMYDSILKKQSWTENWLVKIEYHV